MFEKKKKKKYNLYYPYNVGNTILGGLALFKYMHIPVSLFCIWEYLELNLLLTF